jgi:uncharacterized protein YdaU (DUF1376 family)
MTYFSGKKPLFQSWDESSFRLDTQYLDWQARACYRALLQSAWYGSERPDLPDDDAKLARIIGCPIEIWTECAAAVRAFFTPQIVNGVSVLRQKRLFEDWQRIEAYRKRQAEYGKKRWATESESEILDPSKMKGEGKERKGNEDPQPTLRVPSDNLEATHHPPSPSSLAENLGSCREQESPSAPLVRGERSSGAGLPKPATEEHGNALTENEQKVSDACWDRFKKIPPRGSVDRLLKTLSVEQIVEALHSFADSQEDKDNLEYAEYQFFQDGGCETVVRAQSNALK